MTDTVYQVQIRYTDQFRGYLLHGVGEWFIPPWGPNKIKRDMRTARSAASKYRNRVADGVEVRVVKLTGEWEPVR